MNVSEKRTACNASLPAFFTIEYILFFIATAFFLFQAPQWSTAVALVLIPALFFYPLLYLAPAIVLSSAVAAATKPLALKHNKIRRFLIGATAFVVTFISHLLLVLDAGLYARYSYHINPHILNIFTTPGGFEGMGLDTGEIILLGSGIFALGLFHLALIRCFMRFPRLAFTGEWNFKRRAIKYYVSGLLFFGSVFLISYVTYSFEHFSMNPYPLRAADTIPLYISGTARSLYKKLGFKQPDRDAVRVKLGETAILKNYPQRPIVRKADRPKYNVVWITCESWAAKLYTPEIMPKTAEFAKKGIYFSNHYSGGNVTRQGMFSMFYGLPGNYWHSFFAARRGPVFIDWLKEDGYTFKCITSSKFTYPEFDQTIFFQVAQKDMHSDSVGKSFERDQRNLKLLIKSIEEGASSGKPFFSFMFFESTHHPYSFPKEAEYTKDYLDPFNAAKVTAKDGPRIFNRAANCARHLDMCLDKVYQTLEKKDLLKNTIVVIAGDHGEEYFEKGYLGHSSSFVNEQTKTTLILYYPGIKPGVYSKMSSHLDVVPMLAKFFGVENPAKDYSCGFDLISDPAVTRKYSLIANWSEVFFAGEKYKSLIPTDAASFAKQVITDSDDKPLSDVSAFYREYNKSLIEVQHELTRFTASQK